MSRTTTHSTPSPAASLSPLGLALRWGLWAWMSVVVLAGCLLAPLSQGFAGRAGDSPQSSRIVYFHVPMAVAAFVAFLAAATFGALYLWRRRSRDDYRSVASVEVGLVFCVLATVTGAVWAEIQWGAFWNWDPRQTSVALAILFYGAYLSLRSAVDDPETRARLAGAYSVLGFAVAPFLFFVLPRMASFSLHPKPGSADMEPTILWVVLAGIGAFTALFFWLQSLRSRTIALEERDLLETDAAPAAPRPSERTGF